MTPAQRNIDPDAAPRAAVAANPARPAAPPPRLHGLRLQLRFLPPLALTLIEARLRGW